EVNGRRIDVRAYEGQVQQAIQARQRESSENLGLDDQDAVRNEVWDQLVTSELLESEYKTRRVRVGDDEIVEAIRATPLPEFYRLSEVQNNGKIDVAKDPHARSSG